jgi:hypothetical protein
MGKRTRQYIGILTAVAGYYAVHEGAHWILAMFYGVFRQVRFLGMGMQIDVFAESMTDIQLGLFCLSGPAATLLAGWLLVALTKRICGQKSKILKAVMWYLSLTLLILDPLYLSVLCGFFGGGDMNGIKLLMPEAAARVLFGILGILHGAVIRKYLLPVYRASFENS